MTTTKTLTAGDHVKGYGFTRSFPLTTVRAKYGQDAHDRAVRRGHETAFCVNPGTALISDREESARRNFEAAANFEEAVTVENGELVNIEGELLRVVVNGQKFADPIVFRRP